MKLSSKDWRKAGKPRLWKSFDSWNCLGQRAWGTGESAKAAYEDWKKIRRSLAYDKFWGDYR